MRGRKTSGEPGAGPFGAPLASPRPDRHAVHHEQQQCAATGQHGDQVRADDAGAATRPGCGRGGQRGAFRRTLRERQVKGDWLRAVAVAEEAVELMPDDPRLPRRWDQPSRNAVMSRYGIGTTRANRLVDGLPRSGTGSGADHGPDHAGPAADHRPVP